MQVTKAEIFIPALLRCFAAIAICMVLAAGASATMLTEWNFNASSGPGNASTGTGTSAGSFFPWTSALPVQTGSPNDANQPIVNGGPNNGSGNRSGPQPGEDPSAQSRRWEVKTSTAGNHSPVVTWDFAQGYRAPRHYQMFATADGTTWNPVAGGTGSTISGSNGTASVDASGLVTINTVDGLILDGTGNGYMHDLSYSFPEGTAYDNNPNFGVRWVAAWEPGGSDYVSSFAGTDSSDEVSGYIRSTSAGGSEIRYDLVRVSAVPEPTCLALAFCGLALAGVAGRRRK